MTQPCHNIAHVMTAQLSWHVQNCGIIGSSLFHTEATNISFTRFGSWVHKLFMIWSPGHEPSLYNPIRHMDVLIIPCQDPSDIWLPTAHMSAQEHDEYIWTETAYLLYIGYAIIEWPVTMARKILKCTEIRQSYTDGTYNKHFSFLKTPILKFHHKIQHMTPSY